MPDYRPNAITDRVAPATRALVATCDGNGPLCRAQLTRGGRETLLHAILTEWTAAQLRPTAHVVLEAIGNTMAVVQAVRSRVARVVVDAAILAQLYSSGFVPEVWIPDDATQTLRRQVARRVQIVRQRVRLKNEMHGVLHTYLLPRCPAADLFGRAGRQWLSRQPLPLEERLGVEQRLRELDRLADDLAAIDRLLADAVVHHRALQPLLTITGVNTTVAIGIWAPSRRSPSSSHPRSWSATLA